MNDEFSNDDLLLPEHCLAAPRTISIALLRLSSYRLAPWLPLIVESYH